MLNFVQEGKIVNATAPANVTAGTAAKLGVLFGVYVASALSGEDVPVCTEGVVELPKDNSNIAQFALVYWDDAAKAITTTATNNSKVGYATEAAGTAATTVKVKLVPTI